ncbi:MAG: LamG domain-containing protein, partial [Planctomycetota bacterium]
MSLLKGIGGRSGFVVVVLVVVCLFSSPVYSQPWDGNGIEGDPYQIWDVADMQAIGADANYWDAHFELMADIDLGAYTGTSFNVIGNDVNAFTGVFDGNGHTISNFTYDSNGVDYVGLFGYVDDPSAEIKDLGLLDPNISVVGDSVLDGLFSWWRFDEGNGTIAYDSAGDNHGTVVSGPNEPNWTNGQIGGALSFDGEDDYVDMGDTVKNYLGTSYTVSAWIKADVTPTRSHCIVSYRGSLPAVLFQLYLYPDADIRWTVRDNSVNVAQAIYAGAITTDVWYHVAGVREGNRLDVYVNGLSGIS